MAKQRGKLSFPGLRDHPSLLSLGSSHNFVIHFLLTEFPHPLWFMEVVQTAGGEEQGYLQSRALVFLTILQLRCMMCHLSHAWECG